MQLEKAQSRFHHVINVYVKLKAKYKNRRFLVARINSKCDDCVLAQSQGTNGRQ